MARTVRDAAICLGAMVGLDENDPKTLAGEGKYYTDYTTFLNEEGIEGKRIGLYKPAFGQDENVDILMNKAID